MIPVNEFLSRCLKRTGKLQKQLAEALDMSPSQLSHQFSANRLTFQQYVQSMEFLGLDPRSYFDENDAASIHTGDITNTALLGMATVSVGSPDVSYLRQSLRDKESLIAEKERTIKMQQDMIDFYKSMLNSASAGNSKPHENSDSE
ncbi:MAG: hypothetical protein K2O24_00905 [Muribaculaceae bacterium]|nr:hypothetical protein [Muribaculaceae bacterium]